MNLRSLVRWTAAGLDRVVPPAEGITVLIYHRVGGKSGSAVDLDADVFDHQMSSLSAGGRVMSLQQAVDALAQDRVCDGVVVTFDDGTADFCEVAVPILQRHGISATLYAATDFIDRGQPFPWGAPPASWAALRDAVSTGFVSVESHTHTHRLLNRVDAREAAWELDASIDSIGSHIGVAPQHFAYPKAVPGNPVAEIAVRSRFVSASLAGSKANRPGADLCRLWRTPVQHSDTPEIFAMKARGGMRLEGVVRAATARVRYRESNQ